MSLVAPLADLGEAAITKIYRKSKAKKLLTRVGDGEVLQDDEYLAGIKALRWLQDGGATLMERQLRQARESGDAGKEERLLKVQRDVGDQGIDVSKVNLGPGREGPGYGRIDG